MKKNLFVSRSSPASKETKHKSSLSSHELIPVFCIHGGNILFDVKFLVTNCKDASCVCMYGSSSSVVPEEKKVVFVSEKEFF